MPKATSSQRKLIVIVLLVLAVLGAVVRTSADNPSLARDIGNLLLVLWVPVIGNVVAFFGRRIKWRNPWGFSSDKAFSGQLLVELTPLPAHLLPGAAAAQDDPTTCALVLGTEGFTARLPRPVDDWLAGGTAQALQIEFLRPALALPRFPAAARFRVVAGHRLVGEGRVLEILPGAGR